MNTSKIVFYCTSFILIAISLLVSVRYQLELGTIEREIEASKAQLQATAETTKDPLNNIASEIADYDSKIAQLSIELEESTKQRAASSEQQTQNIDGELSSWLASVDRLSKFQDINPQFGIPEMDTLKATDWLGVTNNSSLETEADYRLALSKLRMIAKSNFAQNIHQALESYQEDHNGDSPQQPSELLAYSDGTLTAEILERYQMGFDEEHPVNINGEKAILFEKNPVDDLWNAKISFGTEKTITMNPFGQLGYQRIAQAYRDFERQNQRKPESEEEFKTYLREQRRPRPNSETFTELYRALSTKPTFK